MTRHRLTRIHRDERGMSYVFVGVGFMAFLVTTTLAMDVGMFMTARSQAQNAADSSALAGALALGFDDYNNRSASGPAVQNAITASAAHQIMGESVTITPADVTFPLGPTGMNNRVRVHVMRNSMPTLMGRYFGVQQVDIEAVATAEASPANAMTCVKPFIIPDRWVERQDPPWDPDDTFEMFDSRGNPLPDADLYIPASEPGYAGYNQESDRGRRLVIRAGSGESIRPTFYFSLAIADITGGDEYRWNIDNCNTTVITIGDIVIQEPGNMVGPTIQGAEGLIARDPNAYWNEVTNNVVTTLHPSPRVFPIPLYDPIYYTTQMMQGRFADFKVANYIGFFLESVQGNEIHGRIIPISGIINSSGPIPAGAFHMKIRLVE
jgi:hypothetical protein